ncbi:MAG TPA: MFS transporter [Verrucomicrobiae bacterium]|nr:MFS transporter [Verrucomicrobiae bacterium]
MDTTPTSSPAPPESAVEAKPEITRLGDLSPQQWKSGIAAWLGWTFDGLELHVYTLVSTPFVAELLRIQDKTDPRVGRYGSIIQAGFLVGWALGGGFFGRLGDRLGRSRALSLTVLTYALFTGLAVFAQTWWHLLIIRFVAALGIGGEWALGASLLSETWPRHWRPWIALVLQSGVNIGVLIACLANVLMAGQPPRYLFLIGVLPALLVFWIRKAVPEPDEWRAAKEKARHQEPRVSDLFRGEILPVTLLTITVCAISLTAHWAFLFWNQQHLRKLPEVLAMSAQQQNLLMSKALYLVMIFSIAGNFFAAWLSRLIGYRQTIAWMCFGYFLAMLGAYGVPRDHAGVLFWLPIIGFFQGLFALFTMYLPPLFPTLLRTTGAGFCYNIGRISAAFGTVFFGLFSNVSDHRLALLYAGFLFLPAGVVSFFLPKMRD